MEPVGLAGTRRAGEDEVPAQGRGRDAELSTPPGQAALAHQHVHLRLTSAGPTSAGLSYELSRRSTVRAGPGLPCRRPVPWLEWTAQPATRVSDPVPGRHQDAVRPATADAHPHQGNLAAVVHRDTRAGAAGHLAALEPSPAAVAARCARPAGTCPRTRSPRNRPRSAAHACTRRTGEVDAEDAVVDGRADQARPGRALQRDGGPVGGGDDTASSTPVDPGCSSPERCPPPRFSTAPARPCAAVGVMRS